MKKKLIVSVIALILSILIGVNSEMLTSPIENVYCKILPEECK